MSEGAISPWFPEQDRIRLAVLGKLIEECTVLAGRAARTGIVGLAGEGTAASITWSQAHGDTGIADVTSGSGTGESAACYRSASTLSGSVSRTMTASANDRFAALWWIAEVVESSGASSANAGNSATSSVASTPLARVGAAAGLAR